MAETNRANQLSTGLPAQRELPPARVSGSALTFPVVGIGASAGGLEPLEALMRHLSADGMAFVVLQHLAPGHDSMLGEILRRATPLKPCVTPLRVVTIHDDVVVEPDTVYVASPDVELELAGATLRVTRRAEHLPRQSIDLLLRSLASELGPRAIGVLLSGAGSDGALGLRAIREQGGTTFVQDPKTAAQPSMPQSAIDLGVTDYSLSPAEIGDELMRLSAHPFVARKRPSTSMNRDSLAHLFELLRRAYGVDFSEYNDVEQRIAHRMVLQKLDKLEDYLRFVDADRGELGLLYADLLIGVTQFFRDREVFEALATSVFPRLLANRGADTPIRIWVPGCASGEEAYSLAMCLVEFLDRLPGARKVQIFATDIDERGLAIARQAIYPRSIEADVSRERLQRFFTCDARGYEVSRRLRDMIVFARHDVSTDPPFSRLDLISCRNVLIYMAAPLQRRVLRIFHYALNVDGCLVLGASESVGEVSDRFTLIERELKIYLKKGGPSSGVFDFTSTAQLGAGAPFSPSFVGARRHSTGFQHAADRSVAERFGPPGLLLDERHAVLEFRGDTRRYLVPATGVATLDAFELVRSELMLELRALLLQVADDGRPRTSRAIRIADNREERRVVLDVTLVDAAQTRGFLVLFREQPGSVTAARPDDPASLSRIEELERELLLSREYLQTTRQQLEVANEELQTSNEELQTSNEELQSTNEELQSTNAQLTMVNEELKLRLTQLTVAKDDLGNVIARVTAPFVIVDMDLCIRVFSSAAKRLLQLTAGDVGRPIADLSEALEAPQLGKTVSQTINTVRTHRQRVRCADGQAYTARIAPYRTSEHGVYGAFIELVSEATEGRDA